MRELGIVKGTSLCPVQCTTPFVLCNTHSTCAVQTHARNPRGPTRVAPCGPTIVVLGEATAYMQYNHAAEHSLRICSTRHAAEHPLVHIQYNHAAEHSLRICTTTIRQTTREASGNGGYRCRGDDDGHSVEEMGEGGGRGGRLRKRAGLHSHPPFPPLRHPL